AGDNNALVALAVHRASERGTILVAAAGNAGPDAPPAYPGALPESSPSPPSIGTAPFSPRPTAATTSPSQHQESVSGYLVPMARGDIRPAPPSQHPLRLAPRRWR